MNIFSSIIWNRSEYSHVCFTWKSKCCFPSLFNFIPYQCILQMCSGMNHEQWSKTSAYKWFCDLIWPFTADWVLNIENRSIFLLWTILNELGRSGSQDQKWGYSEQNWVRASRDFVVCNLSPALLNLAFDLIYLGDLISWIFRRSGLFFITTRAWALHSVGSVPSLPVITGTGATCMLGPCPVLALQSHSCFCSIDCWG